MRLCGRIVLAKKNLFGFDLKFRSIKSTTLTRTSVLNRTLSWTFLPEFSSGVMHLRKLITCSLQATQQNHSHRYLSVFCKADSQHICAQKRTFHGDVVPRSGGI